MLEKALAETQERAQRALDEAYAALARETQARAQSVEAHAATQARLRYRESPQGWLRYPLAAVRRRMGGAR